MKDLYVKACNCKFLLWKFVLEFCFSRFLCDCAINADTREIVRAATLEYQKLTTELINSGLYDTKEDFTVVVQPFMEHMTVPTTVIWIWFE